DMARKSFDFREVVGRDKDSRLGSALKKALDELVTHQGIEAAKRLIKNDKTRMKREGAGQGKFHFHAARERFDLAIERKLELFDEGLFQRTVPSGIEIAKIFEQRANFHPFRNFLIFGDIADLRVGLAAGVAGVPAKNSRETLCSRNQIHEQLDGCGFPRAVLADEGI